MIVRPWDFDMEVEVELDESFVIVLSVKIGGVEVYEMLNDTQLLRIEAAVGRACDL